MTRSERDLVIALRAELAGDRPGAAVRPARRGRPGSGADVAARRAGRRPGWRVRAASGRDAATTRRHGRAFDWDTAAEHCRTAWLRGRFLARGSLSLAGGRTHLEFVVAPDEAPVLAGRLADVGLPASWRIRRGRGVVTWKSGEAVGTFLRRIGAGGALLELEARQVSRALRGDLNRVLNAESANLQRAVAPRAASSTRSRSSTPTAGSPEQPYVVRLVADARRETPEATLGELAERLRPPSLGGPAGARADRAARRCTTTRPPAAATPAPRGRDRPTRATVGEPAGSGMIRGDA